MSAASQGKADAVAFLLSLDGVADDLDLAAHSGGTALMFAAAGGHEEALRLLVDAGGDVDRRVVGTADYVAQVAAQLAAGESDVEPHKDDVTALQVAAQGGHLACIELLLASGADVRAEDEARMSALANAAAGGHVAVAAALIAAGADPNDKGHVDDAAHEHNLLWDAIDGGHAALALALVAKGADANAHGDTGAPALLHAARTGLDAVVAALLTAGAAIDARDETGATALFAAAAEGHTATVSILLAAGAAVDARDGDATTPLMAAAVRGHAAVTIVLLDVGAAVDARNAEGHTALMFAHNGANQVETLRAKYVAVISGGNAADDANLKAIENARVGHASVVTALLGRGADAQIADNDGHVAADFAYASSTADAEPKARGDL